MLTMEKEKLTVYNDDTTLVEIIILDNQQNEGVYRFYPETEDEVTLTIYDKKGPKKAENTVIAEFSADMSDPENIVVDINTENIPSGKYFYDVRLKITGDNQIYHIAAQQEIEIIRRKHT